MTVNVIDKVWGQFEGAEEAGVSVPKIVILSGYVTVRYGPLSEFKIYLPYGKCKEIDSDLRKVWICGDHVVKLYLGGPDEPDIAKIYKTLGVVIMPENVIVKDVMPLCVSNGKSYYLAEQLVGKEIEVSE